MFNNLIVRYFAWDGDNGGIIVDGPASPTGPSDPSVLPPAGGGDPATPATGDTGPGNNNMGSGNPADNIIVAQAVYSNMSVTYYKIDLEATKTNVYGEAVEKWYFPPALVTCLITRNDITFSDDEFGINAANTITVSIPRAILDQYGFLPEVGDVLMDRERMYEVSSIDPTFVTIPGASNQSLQGSSAGYTIIYNLTCYMTRITKLNLIEYYQ